MSRVDPSVDLSVLARPAATEIKAPRRGPKRLIVPLVLLAGFAAVIVASLGDALAGGREVTVVRPVPATGAAVVADDGAPVVQAAGWVEPDPFPMQASALRAGVVREVLALESAVVRKGEVVARLVDDAEVLAAAAAEAAHARAAAEVVRAEAEARAAREAYDAALSVVENDATARADAAARAAEAEARRQAVRRGEAAVKIAEAELELRRALAAEGAAPPWAVPLAEARLEEAAGDLGGLRAEAALAAAEATKAEARAVRAARDKELRIEDRRARDVAEAAMKAAAAALREAAALRDAATLAVARSEIRAPSDGVVLERLVAAGSALTEDKPTALVLYDPSALRVRVDVPQGDVAKVVVGRRAEIRSEARPDRPYAGEVVRLVQKADIQKVTLQAHVRVREPDALLKPEALCQVRFFGAPGAASRSAASGGDAVLLVPARLVVGGRVWVVDPDGPRARTRAVVVGAAVGEKVEIRGGLNASDKLVDGGREGLVEGARIRVREGY